MARVHLFFKTVSNLFSKNNLSILHTEFLGAGFTSQQVTTAHPLFVANIVINPFTFAFQTDQ